MSEQIPDFEWDEAKRQKTLADRFLDFEDAALFFDGRRAFHQPTPRNGEDRWKTTTEIGGVMVTLVWLWREDVIRVVSMRRSHVSEERAYRSAFGG